MSTETARRHGSYNPRVVCVWAWSMEIGKLKIKNFLNVLLDCPSQSDSTISRDCSGLFLILRGKYPTGHHLRVLDFCCKFFSRIRSCKPRGLRDVEQSMLSTLYRIARFESPSRGLNTMSSQLLWAIEEAHKSACESGIPHYKDPATGYKVFTSVSHEKRGFCCGNACRWVFVFQYGRDWRFRRGRGRKLITNFLVAVIVLFSP